MTNYEKGRAGEYEVKKKLESQGYVVFRTAGSHSFCDLICFQKNVMSYPLLIQVKRGVKPSAKAIGVFKAAIREIQVGEVWWRGDGAAWQVLGRD
jgi:Holliday junction resolvase